MGTRRVRGQLTLSGMILAMWVAMGLASGCTSPLQGQTDPGKGTKDVVVFLDFSASINLKDKSLFEGDLVEQIIPSLEAGDRFLIAPINDRTFSGFHPLVEVTFPAKPAFNGWKDSTLDYNRQVKAVEAEVVKMKGQLKSDVQKLFSKPFSSQWTDIFSSLLVAEKLFHNQPRKKVLVLMSDMIVDYQPYRFETVSWSQDTNQEMLEALEQKGSIPDLSGVCVYVTGAAARTAQMAKDIGAFWQSYFERAKADMNPSRYAHVLLHWPPSKSCRV